MDLGKHVEDKELMDRRDRRAGKADDLILDFTESGPDRRPSAPEVVAIVSGPNALVENLPGPVRAAVRWLYRLPDVRDPRPVEIPSEKIRSIDVAVHLDIDRDEAGLTTLEKAVDRAIISRIPGAGDRP